MYVTAKVIFRMMMVFFPNMPWLAYFLDELTETALWAMVCYNFRLRLPNAFILSQFSDPFSAYSARTPPPQLELSAHLCENELSRGCL